MSKVCGLRLGPNFVLRLAADKNFYLRFTFEKMHVFPVCNDKHLRSYGCGTNFMTMGKYKSKKLKYKVKSFECKSTL